MVVLGHSLADVPFGFLQMQALRIWDRNASTEQKESKTANSSSPKQLQILVVDMNTTFIRACTVGWATWPNARCEIYWYTHRGSPRSTLLEMSAES